MFTQLWTFLIVFSLNRSINGYITSMKVPKNLALNGNIAETSNIPNSDNARALSDSKVNVAAGLAASITVSGLLNPKAVFAALGDDDEVEIDKDYSKFVTTDSGLKYFDLKVGDGAVPLPGDLVQVHYTGWLDGFDGVKKFDSSYDRRQPLQFKAGVKQVISGWDEGLLTNLKVGGKRKLIIPPELGYGSRGAGGVIPPNAVLYFTIELVAIGAKRIR